MVKTLDKQDIEDLLVGAKILGTGGGGETRFARPMIEEVYAKKKHFGLIGLDEVPDDEIVMIVGMVGGGVSEEVKRKVASLPKMKERPEFAAKTAFAEYLGKEPFAFFPSETGRPTLWFPCTLLQWSIAAALTRMQAAGLSLRFPSLPRTWPAFMFFP